MIKYLYFKIINKYFRKKYAKFPKYCGEEVRCDEVNCIFAKNDNCMIVEWLYYVRNRWLDVK